METKVEGMTHLPINDLFKEAERLEFSGDVGKAADLYKSWLALNHTDALVHAAYFNYGVALSRTGDRAGAINAMRECIRIKPDFHPHISISDACSRTAVRLAPPSPSGSSF